MLLSKGVTSYNVLENEFIPEYVYNSSWQPQTIRLVSITDYAFETWVYNTPKPDSRIVYWIIVTHSLVFVYGRDCRDKWVPVTTAGRVLRLRMEERPPIWRVAANILNKQSRAADKGWSSSLGVGRGADNSSPWKPMSRNIHKARAGTCEYGNELSGSIKCGEFLD